MKKPILAAADGIIVLGTSGSGTETVAEVMKCRPEVLVTEMTLPELDGFSAVRELNEKMGPAAPAAFMLSAPVKRSAMTESMTMRIRAWIISPSSWSPMMA